MLDQRPGGWGSASGLVDSTPHVLEGHLLEWENWELRLEALPTARQTCRNRLGQI